MVLGIVSGIVAIFMAIAMGITHGGAGWVLLTWLLCTIGGIVGFLIGKFLRDWVGEYSFFTSGGFLGLVLGKFNALYGPMIAGFLIGQFIPLWFVGTRIEKHNKNVAAKETVTDVKDSLMDVDMVFIPGGKMFLKRAYNALYSDDGKLIQGEDGVNLSVGDFEIEKCPVTRDMYDMVMKGQIYEAQGGSSYRTMSWYAAIVFCNKLSKMNKLTPCYSIGGTTDTDKWGEIPSQVSFEWDNVKCDFSANGYRLPTLPEFAYAMYASEYEYPEKYVYTTYQQLGNVFGLKLDISGSGFAGSCHLWNWYTKDYSVFESDLTGPKMGTERAVAESEKYEFRGTNTTHTNDCLRLARTVSRKDSKNVKKEFNLADSGIVMKKIDGGEFECGTNDFERYVLPKHNATVKDFYLSETKVTSLQENLVRYGEENYNLDKNSYMKGTNEAVGFGIEWAVSFCNILSLKCGFEPCYEFSKEHPWSNEEKITFNENANGFRLPTEEEWEYAAKGGQNKNDFMWSGSDDFNEVVNTENSLVAQKKANTLGLYDMNGIMDEWAWPLKDGKPIPYIGGYDRCVVRGGHGSDYRDINVYRRMVADANEHCGLRLCRNAF